MKITGKAWIEYQEKMAQLSRKAADLMEVWLDRHGTGNRKELIDYANALVMKYGQAAGALACEMYDKTAEAQGKTTEEAEIAELPSYGEVARAINGTMKESAAKLPGTVARLTKQQGADTTLKNALRDGAQFAWIAGGGESCAFCIALAARGWQYVSTDALKNGHAEHIHAKCTCQYAVRFDEKSGIEGYDPDKYRQLYEAAAGSTPEEKIRFIRRTIATEQEYRKVKRGRAETITFERNNQKCFISVKKIETYERTVYISDNAKIKPKALNAIVKNTKEAEREYGLSEAETSEIVILAKDELDGAYGLYDACTNRTYYNELITDQEVQSMAGGENITERHETWHAKQAANYRRIYGDITEQNKAEYTKKTCEKAKKNLDAMGITGENVTEVSPYAKERYFAKRYDETEAEVMALRKK